MLHEIRKIFNCNYFTSIFLSHVDGKTSRFNCSILATKEKHNVNEVEGFKNMSS